MSLAAAILAVSQVVNSPCAHGVRHRHEFRARIGQLITHLWRHSVGRAPADYSILLQFLELSRQNLSLTPGNRSRIWANRRDPDARCQTIRTFHLPAITFAVPCTGHPKLFFIAFSMVLGAYKIVGTSRISERMVCST